MVFFMLTLQINLSAQGTKLRILSLRQNFFFVKVVGANVLLLVEEEVDVNRSNNFGYLFSAKLVDHRYRIFSVDICGTIQNSNVGGIRIKFW